MPEYEKETTEQQRLEKEQLEDLGTVWRTRGPHAIHCLTVIGQIEGHVEAPQGQKTTKYEHVIPQLVAVQEDPAVEGLLVLINTVGGDVEAGLALAELIASISKPSATVVLGGGHSIGIPLAVSARRSFIVPTATMTVHPVRHSGMILGVPQTMRWFEQMQERITGFVAAHSGMTEKRYTELMLRTGELVMDAADQYGAEIIPVDSEHSAIFQCLAGCRDRGQVRRLILTCSGGPFYGRRREELRYVTRADALCHPNWRMGAKITIDCATLMNKGLELIEAVWLFGLPEDKIQIVVQRESIVHSAVQFADHSVIAQLGVPDMRIPIQYALTYPKRVPGVVPELDFAALKVLTFDVADDETFRCLAACKKAIKKGGLGPCAANGANEEAVKLFLEDKIGFLDIGRLVEAVVDSDSFGGEYTLSDVYECDRMAREFVRAHL